MCFLSFFTPGAVNKEKCFELHKAGQYKVWFIGHTSLEILATDLNFILSYSDIGFIINKTAEFMCSSHKVCNIKYNAEIMFFTFHLQHYWIWWGWGLLVQLK